jgi:IS30 family transposase
MAHTELGLRERRTIKDMLNAKMSVESIAAEIGRHRSTVFREIKRNRFADDELPKLNGYYGMDAQKSAVERRARRRKLVRFVDLRMHVITQLKAGWSPEQIAGRLQYDGQSLRVSHETIYAYVYGPDGQSEELARHLPHRRKKRQPRCRRTPLGFFFRPIGQSMNDQTTSKPVRHSANGRAI